MEYKNLDADVIIVGAGPAGMSAAVWCVELGLKTIVFEKEAETGGQLLRIYNPITNYIGLETANGRELRDVFMHSFARYKLAAKLSNKIIDIDATSRSVLIDGGNRATAQALIIATGIRRRKLDVPGEKEFAGKGIIDSGSNEKEKATGKTVIIVGGGDAALENALILAGYASKVYIIHRRSELSARPEFVEKARQNPKIELRLNTVVDSIKGSDQIESVEITNVTTRKTEDLTARILLGRIGVQPNTELIKDKVALDPQGYVLIDNNCETNIHGVYAIGDAANPISPTISTATGTGATAAKVIAASLNH